MRLIFVFGSVALLTSRALAQTPIIITQAALLPSAPRLIAHSVLATHGVGFLHRSDSSTATRRPRHALIGAAVGTAIGIAAGVASVRSAGISCGDKGGSCARRRAEIAIGIVTLNAAVGAGIGALLGALVP